MKKNYPSFLLGLYLILFVALGISPVSRSVWFAEIIPAVGVVLLLAACYRNFRLSNLSYSLMFCWLAWHTIGAHYTFANVPFDWCSELTPSGRNHFDRISHFMVGFYAFPIAEWLIRKKHAGPKLSGAFGLLFVMAVAAFYEIIEWQYAVIEGGSNGIEFLGSQGDIWDAQKDMLSDTLGAVFSLTLFYITRPDRKLAQQDSLPPEGQQN